MEIYDHSILKHCQKRVVRMNVNNSNSNLDHSKPGSDPQIDAIAKVAILSLVWSLSGLSKDKRTNDNSKTPPSDIHVNLSDLKE